MKKLNKTFESGQILTVKDLNDIVSKINEIIESINKSSPTPEDESTSEEQ